MKELDIIFQNIKAGVSIFDTEKLVEIYRSEIDIDVLRRVRNNPNRYCENEEEFDKWYAETFK